MAEDKVIRGYPISRFNGLRCRVMDGYSQVAYVRLERPVERAGGYKESMIYMDKKYLGDPEDGG